MKIHPLCDILPAMEPAEFEELRRSIREHGYDESQPVIIFHGMILDGRNRYNAAKAEGVEPFAEAFEGTEREAAMLVMRRNVTRRNLTASQRAMVAQALEPYFAESAKTRMERGKSDPEEIVPQGRAPQAREQAAKAAGVNPRYVSDAKRVANEAPDLAQKVRDGEVTLPQAKKQLKAPPPKKKAPPPRQKKDAIGRPVHAKAAPHLARAEDFNRLRLDLHDLKRRVLKLAGDPVGHNLNAQSIERDFRNLVNQVENATPHTSCPLGDPCSKSCRACKGLQFVTEDQWKAMPREFKR